ncbi:MAG: response regulator [Tannerella sp.]|jgi:signal transduction histidine kinase/ligand-binding sensor domain-containing protein/DNA-binding response OmpR family regulator|nr:response regulator [Tannerella sp.]
MKIKLSALLFLLFLGLNSHTLIHSQSPKFYSTDNGLSNSLVNKIVQDRNGFIWIATEWGLNKYDSNNFTVYNNIEGDSTSLTHNYIRTIFEDKNKQIYIGTLNGLMKYNLISDSFEEIAMFGLAKNQVYPHITNFSEMSNGDILISTSGQGIYILKKDEKTAHYHELSNKISSSFINLIYQDRNENLWIGIETGGLYCYDTKTETIDYFDEKTGLSSEYVSAITEDRSGNILIGTLTNGLNVYNKKTRYIKQIPYYEGNELFVKSFFWDSDNNLLIGADGQGLKYYDYENQCISSYKLNIFPYDVSRGKIHSILQDRDGNLWLGIFQKGVAFIPRISNQFGYWGFKQYDQSPIGSGCVMSICKDQNGTTWVGVDNGGIYGVNAEGQRIAHFMQTSAHHSISNTILSILDDNNGNLWLGSYTQGLAKMDKRTGRAEYVHELSGQKVYYIAQDKNNNIIVGTYGSGMFIISATGSIKQFESSKTERDILTVDELCNDWINSIHCDQEGLIWIGHYKGLSCYNPKNNSFINYFNQNNLLPSTVVISLSEDKLGKIWIGTTDGLFVFNKFSKEFVKFTTDDGLPNNVICGIEEGRDGNIWLSTYHGICKCDIEGKQFISYYIGDGIQGNEFTRGASFRDSEGNVFFGGANGITFFNPNSIQENKRDLNLVLTGFFLPNKVKKQGVNVLGVKSPIIDASKFILSHNENSFSLELSSMDYANAERISYQYKMEGLNNNWMSTYVGINQITYNNLSPGTYTLFVRASDNQTLSPEKAFIIIVKAPLYASWWAKLLYIVLTIILLLGIYNYYSSRFKFKQKLIQKEHNEAINEAKLQFFINISHEIRTPMSLIISPLEKLMAKNNDEQLNKTYLIIYRNAKRILRLINQLMDIRKLDKGQMKLRFRETDIVGFINDLMLTFEYQAINKNINFKFVHKDEQLKVWIDLNNFDKVLLNLLSNAFKFTPDGGVVEIKLETGKNKDDSPSEDFFQITVSDSGIGIDENKVEKIFERFYQIESTNSNFGTGIGLHLSQLLVELHHGSILAVNRNDIQGSRFIIQLPLGNSHLKPDEFEDSSLFNGSEEKLSEYTDNAIGMEIQNVKKAKSKTNYKIIIVEDDDEIRLYLKNELSHFFRITDFINGKDGYNAILLQQPDLVISDIMMPEMDGITLCRKIKQNVNISHIPIILLTAKSNIENKIEGLEIGADAYISKPFNINELAKTADNLIRNRARLKAKYTGVQEQEDKISKIELRSSDEVLLEKIMRIINNNLSNPELNVEMLSDSVGLSRVHLHRKLKELTSLSSRDFIRSIRLKQAASLLLSKKLTISEVAYATGFSNLSHFSNSFKEFHGMTPSEYVNHYFEQTK